VIRALKPRQRQFILGGMSWVALLLLAGVAHAYKLGTIRGGAEILQSPDGGSSVLENLSSGARVYTSDRPSRGYYKVKSAKGTLGWVREDLLDFDGAAPAAPTPPPAASSDDDTGSRRRSRGATKREEATRTRSSGRMAPYGFRLVGNLNLFKLADLNAHLGIDALGNGVGIGGEFLYPVGTRTWAVLRVEKISKLVQYEVQSSSWTYDLAIASMPIQVGLEYALAAEKTYQITASGLVGLGMGTKYTSTSSSQTAPNITEFTGSPLTFMIRLGWDYKLSSSFAVGAEAGYRILKLAEAVPTTAGNGVELYGGAQTPWAVNLSGPVGGLAITFLF
jgi:hypothetical protein